jgi:hypothetical protein
MDGWLICLMVRKPWLSRNLRFPTKLYKNVFETCFIDGVLSTSKISWHYFRKCALNNTYFVTQSSLLLLNTNFCLLAITNFPKDYHLVEAHTVGGGTCEFWWPLKLCWRERKLVAGSPKPDRSKGRIQNRSLRLEVERGANNSTS